MTEEIVRLKGLGQQLPVVGNGRRIGKGQNKLFKSLFPARLLMAAFLNNNPLPGDIVFVSRGLYKHYGIYISNDRIVNFAPKSGFELNPKEAYIQATNLENFLKGGMLEIDASSPARYSPDEIIKRAEYCVGTNKEKYNLAFHNCEHFARWCKSGVATSHQVRNVVKGIVATTAAITVAVAVASSMASSEKTEKDLRKSVKKN